MPFMEPQVEHGSWYVIDGPAGTEAVPADLVGTVTVMKPAGKVEVRHPTVAELRDLDRMVGGGKEGDDVRLPIPSALRDYCENSTCWSIELREGYGARLSAPGYLDCTPWTVFDTREEAELSFNEFDDGEGES